MAETAGPLSRGRQEKTSQFGGVIGTAGCPLTPFPALPMVRRLLRMGPRNLSPDVELGKKAGFPEKIMRDVKVRQA
jgi:hypothetical protein